MSVYFIRVGRYMKVGYSENPERRCANLRSSATAATFPVDAPTSRSDRRLYKVIKGSRDTEATMHRLLSDFYVGLEWYLAEPEFVAYVDALPNELPRDYPAAVRPGGFDAVEYQRVQAAISQRELEGFLNKIQRQRAA